MMTKPLRRASGLLLGVTTLALAAALALGFTPARAENHIDGQRTDAPELAAYGPHAVGVRTLTLVNRQQIDIVKLDPQAPAPAADALPRYDRSLAVELWYPAEAGSQGSTVLKALMRDGKTEVDLHGKAVRDAAPLKDGPGWPLVIVSHGFPGNRFLMSPIAENLASKGYVVASIDHADSTYHTQSPRGFSSTLVNRPLDQLFVLNEMARLAKDPASFLNGRVDANRTAVLGYSMGGYGALLTAGAGLSDKVVDGGIPGIGSPAGTLGIHRAGSAEQRGRFDARVKTVVAIAPWGFSRGLFTPDSLKGVRVPVLFMAGSVDDVSGYDNGVRATWQATTGVPRALLTFDNANHNAGAPMPPPAEALRTDPATKGNFAGHYIDAVWDNVRMNNVAQHFVAAWLGRQLKADPAMDAYLSLLPESNRGLWAMDDKGQPKPEHTHWKGFPNRTAKGLRYELLPAGQ